jgi:membrane associated rhomboid family serine protease
MGILERDYYRDKQPAWVGRISVCTWLIILNVVIYLVQLATRNTAGSPVGPFTAALWLDPDELLDGQVWRLLTCAFLHTPFSPFHILFNMLFLWLLGREIEEIYGSREFAAFYLLAALLASFGYLATVWAGVIGKAPMLGASGAVTAVLVVYAMHFPNRMFLLFLIIPVPAWVFVVFNVAKDLFGVLGAGGAAVAFTAHLSGAAFGLLYAYFDWRVLNWWPKLGQRKPRLRIYREPTPISRPTRPTTPPEPVTLPSPPSEPSAQPSAATADESLESALDRVLEKVAKSGQESLTPSERSILLRASEIYRNRRR